ncbi:MAG: DUF4350 domain-containing protein [Actinobacteria bacterium]|nr:DUF4350 domain-containing protein [Actinomycetota bacterium]
MSTAAPPTTLPRPRRRRTGARSGAYAVAVLIGLAVLSSVINAFFPSQHGPTSSSYATTAGGLAAYAELLGRAGHPVSQLRRPPAAGLLAPAQTVIVLDPDALLGSEGRALAAFAAAGGRLLAGGSTADAFLRTIVARPPRLVRLAPSTAEPLTPTPTPTPETTGVRRVVTLGQGGWAPESVRPGTRAVLGRPGEPPLLLVMAVGRGQIALLADSSPLANRLLATADNARLGVNLAGPGRRPVVFVESVHGYGVARGLAALPGRWWWTFALLTLAGLAWVAGRWRRLGPPSPRGRTLPPARSAYLQAMTTILRRTDAPVEVAGLARASCRRLTARRGRLAADAPPDQLREAARRLGLTDAQASLIAADATPAADDLLVLGAALARLQTGAGPAARSGRPGR